MCACVKNVQSEMPRVKSLNKSSGSCISNDMSLTSRIAGGMLAVFAPELLLSHIVRVYGKIIRNKLTFLIYSL